MAQQKKNGQIEEKWEEKWPNRREMAKLKRNGQTEEKWPNRREIRREAVRKKKRNDFDTRRIVSEKYCNNSKDLMNLLSLHVEQYAMTIRTT